MDIKDFDNKAWHFHGVDGNVFVLTQKGHRTMRFFEAIEDPSDDYRSCLDEVRELGPKRDVVYRRTPIVRDLLARVMEEKAALFHGLELVDRRGHVWLAVGTDYTEDYYPVFVCRYSPPTTEG